MSENVDNCPFLIKRLRKYIPVVFSFIFLLNTNQTLAQESVVDTSVINSWIKQSENIKKTDPETATTIAKKIIHASEQINYQKGKAKALNILGIISYYQDDIGKTEDLLLQALEIMKELNDDEAVSSSYNNLGIIFRKKGDQQKAKSYFLESIKIKEELEDSAGLAKSFNNYAILLFKEGSFKEAEDYFQKSIGIKTKLKDSLGLASSYNNIGAIYESQGAYIKSLEYYNHSLKIKMAMGEMSAVAETYSNIGNLLELQNELKQARANYSKCLEIKLQLKDSSGIAVSYNNIGNIFRKKNLLDSAESYYKNSLRIRVNNGYTNDAASSYLNLGTVNKQRKEFDKAEEYFYKSLQSRIESGNNGGLAINYLKLGALFVEKNQIKKGIEYLEKAKRTGEKYNDLNTLLDIYYYLSVSYGEQGSFKKAYENHMIYKSTSDLLQNNENVRTLTAMHLNFTHGQQLKEDSIQHAQEISVQQIEFEKEKAVKEEKLKRQKMYTLIGISGGLILLMFLVYVFRNLGKEKKSNQIILNQKEEVTLQKDVAEKLKKEAIFQKDLIEEKNKELTDSMTYAKRIQEAILPPTKLVKEWLPNSFILYKPKDIVAGDFYWMEVIGDTVFFSAADCTGHGVPGAMVSVVCHNALNKTVKELRITQPSKILDKVRELVVETFEKSEEDVKDGMDLALCSLNTKTKELQYAGANNPLWIIRKNTIEIEETKATKQAIGKVYNPTPFVNHSLKLNDGDSIYIFSDGYVDQFGGEKGKKFKAKAFRELLLSIKDKPMESQRAEIDNSFEAWRGSLEQIDDVCVIGVKV